MTDRFEELLSRLVDDELTQIESEELTDLVRDDSTRQAELQTQLEAAELLALAVDEVRTPERFLVGLRFASKPVALATSASPTVAGRALTAWWLVPLFGVVVFGYAMMRPSRQSGIAATVQSAVGVVRCTGAGGQIQELELGHSVAGGTFEVMAPDAWATIELEDGSTVTISGRSVLSVSSLADGQKILRLREGTISAQIRPQPPGKPMLVQTPSAELEVVGTQFNVDANAMETRLAVNEGLVRFKRLSDGEIVDVHAEHQAVASLDEPDKFTSNPRGATRTSWQSDLKQDVRYGKWIANLDALARKLKIAVSDGGLSEAAAVKQYKQAATLNDSGTVWAMPFVKDRSDKADRAALVQLSAAGDPSRPVVLAAKSRVRITGRLFCDGSASVMFGLTTNNVAGGFGGKYATTVAANELVSLESVENTFEIELPLGKFESITASKTELSEQAAGKELAEFWCLARGKVKLEIRAVELLE